MFIIAMAFCKYLFSDVFLSEEVVFTMEVRPNGECLVLETNDDVCLMNYLQLRGLLNNRQ